ncbi:MAG: universal stress protein [Pedosphaera sp.]|nr:universal stress protein [Pedosphaera sp.]
MKRLLIAYDGSPGAESVLEDLPVAGLPARLEVCVISVADVWLPSDKAGNPADKIPLTPAIKAARAQANTAVESMRQIADEACVRLQARFPTWTVRPFICADSPGWAIVGKAVDWNADLVSVGSHGRSVLERFFLGSVGQRVVAEAACSVRVVRARKDAVIKPLRIMVAVDGSTDSAIAVEEAASRAWSAHTQFMVAAIKDPRLQAAGAWPSPDADQWVSDHFRDSDDWVCDMAKKFTARLSAAGWPAESHVFEGDPKHVLLKKIEQMNADCLFLGARGLHHGDRHFLGTLASAVSARAHCTVEIVRPLRAK